MLALLRRERPSVPTGTEASPEPAPSLRVSQSIPWYDTSWGSRGMLRWEQATLSKSSECTARKERRGKERRGNERKALGARSEVSEADQFPKCFLAGVCRDSPARRCIPRPPALLLACYLGRQLQPPEVSAFFQQGPTQPRLQWGFPASNDSVVAPPASHQPCEDSARVGKWAQDCTRGHARAGIPISSFQVAVGGGGAECGNTGFADDLVGNEDTASFRISLVLLTVFTVYSPVTCISKLGVVRCIIMTLLLPFFNDKKATSFESSDINQTNFSSPLSCAVSLLVDLLVSLF